MRKGWCAVRTLRILRYLDVVGFGSNREFSHDLHRYLRQARFKKAGGQCPPYVFCVILMLFDTAAVMSSRTICTVSSAKRVQKGWWAVPTLRILRNLDVV